MQKQYPGDFCALAFYPRIRVMGTAHPVELRLPLTTRVDRGKADREAEALHDQKYFEVALSETLMNGVIFKFALPVRATADHHIFPTESDNNEKVTSFQDHQV
ncbi:hypothetical protein AVEN_215468-1 [Araneus ventricosus]|uniref:Uncharacterized protein n=1 Tax=Araneus ventricosus TaxID=182803 RepID=A0A4Y2WBQ4_ARAVE|nr:hypothetical protein AVEN_215468-1 [Araneus ventricosus]